jgi:hypothetical protein
MEKQGAKIKIDEYKGPLGSIKGFELTTGGNLWVHILCLTYLH